MDTGKVVLTLLDISIRQGAFDDWCMGRAGGCSSSARRR